MNAQEIVQEIKDIVVEPAYDNSILTYANRAQRFLADNLMLPDLKAGTDDVETATDSNMVALPDDYHKGLYLAFVDGEYVDIHKDMASLVILNGKITEEAGSISDVLVHGSNLMYQSVPATATTVTLHYYRQPVAMTDSSSSYPDGLAGYECFDWAIIHYVVEKIFDKIEDGVEEKKINTMYHRAKLKERMEEIDSFAESNGKLYPMRPSKSTQVMW